VHGGAVFLELVDSAGLQLRIFESTHSHRASIMKIMIIAWGSLIWSRDDLAAGPFEPRGPELSIEFSRISRDGRLTLVIDEANGSICQTYAAVSQLNDLQAAMENLRFREGMLNLKPVGYIHIKGGTESATARQRHPGALARIHDWSKLTDTDAVIWTALDSNFELKVNKPYSAMAAIQYLERLPQAAQANALRYIRRAPLEIRTQLRAAVIQRWPTELDQSLQ